MILETKVKPRRRVWTYEDYLNLEDDKRYEVINGRLYEMPAPTPLHQKISRELGFMIWEFVKVKVLGEVFFAPIDIVLSDTLVIQPDIVFISKENLRIVGDKAITGIPDLVVEIVSPASYTRDRDEKFRIYEERGVKEYWIVLPKEKVIEVWCLKGRKYVLHSVAVEEGEVESCVLKGLKVDIKKLGGT
jgi:Uma2 family endonuclease